VSSFAVPPAPQNVRSNPAPVFISPRRTPITALIVGTGLRSMRLLPLHGVDVRIVPDTQVDMFKQRRMNQMHAKIEDRHHLYRAAAQGHVEEMTAAGTIGAEKMKVEPGNIRAPLKIRPRS